ncbi:MAG: hypothetical protein PVH62_00180 [Anaerolineae bacterium]
MREGRQANRVEMVHGLGPLLPAELFDRLGAFHHTATTFLPRYLLKLSPRARPAPWQADQPIDACSLRPPSTGR